MATLPEGITQKELDEYLKLDLAEKKIKDRKAILNEKIKNAFVASKPGTYVFEQVVVKFNDAHKFDTAAFEAKHPFAKDPQYYTPKVDIKAIEPDVKARFSTTVERRMSVDKAQ